MSFVPPPHPIPLPSFPPPQPPSFGFCDFLLVLILLSPPSLIGCLTWCSQPRCGLQVHARWGAPRESSFRQQDMVGSGMFNITDLNSFPTSTSHTEGTSVVLPEGMYGRSSLGGRATEAHLARLLPVLV